MERDVYQVKMEVIDRLLNQAKLFMVVDFSHSEADSGAGSMAY